MGYSWLKNVFTQCKLTHLLPIFITWSIHSSLTHWCLHFWSDLFICFICVSVQKCAQSHFNTHHHCSFSIGSKIGLSARALARPPNYRLNQSTRPCMFLFLCEVEGEEVKFVQPWWVQQGGLFSHKMEDEETKVAFIGPGMENIFLWKQRRYNRQKWRGEAMGWCALERPKNEEDMSRDFNYLGIKIISPVAAESPKLM